MSSEYLLLLLCLTGLLLSVGLFIHIQARVGFSAGLKELIRKRTFQVIVLILVNSSISYAIIYLSKLEAENSNRQNLENTIKSGSYVKYGNIEVGGEESFKAYCRIKELTYISYTSGDVGTAQDGSGIQRDYIWDSGKKNWEEY